MFFHINLCCSFVLANVCQLLFAAFYSQICRSVAGESLPMSIVQSCKEICVLCGWWRVLFPVIWKCAYFWRNFWECWNSWSSVFFSAMSVLILSNDPSYLHFFQDQELKPRPSLKKSVFLVKSLENLSYD